MRLKGLIFAISSLLLTGCVAAMVVGAAASVIVYDKRTVASIDSDARIFYVLHKKLVTEPSFRGSRIEVISFNQVVLLVGQMRAASLKVAAEKIAQATPEVKRVYNEISIEPSLSLTEISNDSLLTAKVRSYMLSRKGLESGSIRAVTEHGVVYLMGIVTREQAAIAVDVARQVPGVRKVVKVFQYITYT